MGIRTCTVSPLPLCHVHFIHQQKTALCCFFFGLCPIWDWRIEFSLATFSGLHAAASIVRPTRFAFMYFLITSLHLSFDIHNFRCPPATIFRVTITITYSAYLSTWPDHLSLASVLISTFLRTSIRFIPIIHINIIIYVLSSEFYRFFLSALVSLPYIITCLMAVLHSPTAAMSKMGIHLSHAIPNISRHIPHPAPTRCLTFSSQPPQHTQISLSITSSSHLNALTFSSIWVLYYNYFIFLHSYQVC